MDNKGIRQPLQLEKPIEYASETIIYDEGYPFYGITDIEKWAELCGFEPGELWTRIETMIREGHESAKAYYVANKDRANDTDVFVLYVTPTLAVFYTVEPYAAVIRGFGHEPVPGSSYEFLRVGRFLGGREMAADARTKFGKLSHDV
jgi:hypothetical protein